MMVSELQQRGKLEIYGLYFIYKTKTIINPALTIKEIVLLVRVKLVKPNATQKLSGMNIMIQLKVQNHRCKTKIKSTTVLHGLH